jgi:nicotinamidase-related amidase
VPHVREAKDDCGPNLKERQKGENMSDTKSGGVWDSKECALLLIDYQPEVMRYIRSHDPKVSEVNARYLAKAALAFDIPIILSTVAVQMGVNNPTIPTLRNEIPNIPEIDRTSMDSWVDRAFVEAVKKTGRKRLVMSGIVTEVCLAYAVVSALKDGYEVTIISDASGGLTRESHDLAVLRMMQAGAVPNTAQAMITEWFRDWAGPLAPAARKVIVPFLKETAILTDTYLPENIAEYDAQKSEKPPAGGKR